MKAGLVYLRQRASTPQRSPQTCGWEIAQRAETILETLSASPRAFYSLRATAKILSISTQPVRDWIRLGQMKRDGPRHQISRMELIRFVNDLADRAEPYDPQNYPDRIEYHRKAPSRPWRKLAGTQFKWPNGRNVLTPVELAGLIGCHPSLIIKAIHAERVCACRRTPSRWGITRRAWRRAFFL